MSEHATVKVDGYIIPLIGVPKEATEGACEGCQKPTFHITDLELVGTRMLCPECRQAESRKPL